MVKALNQGTRWAQALQGAELGTVPQPHWVSPGALGMKLGSTPCSILPGRDFTPGIRSSRYRKGWRSHSRLASRNDSHTNRTDPPRDLCPVRSPLLLLLPPPRPPHNQEAIAWALQHICRNPHTSTASSSENSLTGQKGGLCHTCRGNEFGEASGLCVTCSPTTHPPSLGF